MISYSEAGRIPLSPALWPFQPRSFNRRRSCARTRVCRPQSAFPEATSGPGDRDAKEVNVALTISVFKNNLATSPKPYFVRSCNAEVVDYDRLVDSMARGRTTISKVEILAVMQLYKEELLRQLSEGRKVKTPTGTFFLSAMGSLDSPEDPYAPGGDTNHKVRLHHVADRGFEADALSELRIERAERPDLSAPRILDARPAGGTGPGPARTGEIVVAKGLRLRFDPKDPRQGLFFLDASGKEERSAYYPLVKPGTVMCSVPERLAPGVYALAVRTASPGGSFRESRFESLRVA